MGNKKTMVAACVLVVGGVLGMTGFVQASASPAFSRRPNTEAVSLHDDIMNSLTVRSIDGPGGTEVRVRGYVSPSDPRCPGLITIRFVDYAGGITNLASVPGGDIDVTRNIPGGAHLGAGKIQGVRRQFIIFQGRPRCINLVTAQTPFTVTNGPGIFGFTPRSGRAGTVVTITGIRFAGAIAVKFNNTPSVFNVDSDSQITATVPTGATSGPIEIDTRGGLLIQKAISGPDFVVCSAVCGWPVHSSRIHELCQEKGVKR